MSDEAVVIPEKIYFKIGEVCEIVGVQAHVLRYWETEFPTLSPQKNKSGQRSYRRRDVEMALRIKQLLYKEMFTIAGARKKLQSESRGGSKQAEAAKPVEMPQPAAIPVPTQPARPTVSSTSSNGVIEAPLLFDAGFIREEPEADKPAIKIELGENQREVIRTLASHLLELREMLRATPR